MPAPAVISSASAISTYSAASRSASSWLIRSLGPFLLLLGRRVGRLPGRRPLDAPDHQGREAGAALHRRDVVPQGVVVDAPLAVSRHPHHRLVLAGVLRVLVLVGVG